MEPTMIKLRVLSATAVVAVVLPTASFAQEQHGVARGGGAPVAHFSGGGPAFHPGGVSAPVAHFNAVTTGVRAGGVSAPAAQVYGGGAGMRTGGVGAPAVAQLNGGASRGGYGGRFSPPPHHETT